MEAKANVQQYSSSVHQAEAAFTQASAQMELAEKTRNRDLLLSEEGALPKAAYDQAQSAYLVAKAAVASAADSIASAKAAANAAEMAQRAAEQDVVGATHSVDSAIASQGEAEAALQTLVNQPRPQDLAIAVAQVEQARASVGAAQAALSATEVRAPFNGVVSEIVCEEGSPVTAAGVLRMIASDKLQVRLDIDESNLGDLRVGQRAIIGNPVDPHLQVTSILTKIFSEVDPARGTIRVTLTPDEPAEWLRPGRTVDVSIILRMNVKRLTVPEAAVRKIGDETVVFVAVDGHAASRVVTAGLVTRGQVAVLSGLTGNEEIITNAGGLVDGARIRSDH